MRIIIAQLLEGIGFSFSLVFRVSTSWIVMKDSHHSEYFFLYS
jgi:hypothetical protein